MKKFIVTFLIVFISGLFLFHYNQIDKQPIVNTNGREFAIARVVNIVEDNIQEDGSRAGNQIVQVIVNSGKYKGEILEATSSNGYLFGAACEVGTKVVIIVSHYENYVNTSVYSYDRGLPLFLFICMFISIVLVVSGKNGLKAIIALAVSLILLIFFFLPFIYRGNSPILGAIIVAILTTTITMYLIGGITTKTISAIIGTTGGIIVAGLFAVLFSKMCKVNGMNVSTIESLVVLEQINNMKVNELLFAGLLISTLGAVMDVAMSISSAIEEIYKQNPLISRKELFQSGMNVGKDMMSTMINTLILAFVGSSINVLILNYSYDLPFLQIINSNNILIEIMQGLSGSLGIVLCVPFVSIISSSFLVDYKRYHCSVE